MKTCKHCTLQFNTQTEKKIFCSRRCKEKFFNIEQYVQKRKKLVCRKIIANSCRICKKACHNYEDSDNLCKKCYNIVFKRKLSSLSIETNDILKDLAYNKDRERRFLDGDGYAIICKPNHPNSKRHGRIREHVFVMSEKLGRPIKKGETVHHIYGIKDDNRLENLELWATSHPYGQRVDDKIKWAKNFLEEYGYAVEKR